ncbi:MAG: hypothetical protein KBC73_01650 [Burkholderiaceae bacterium]|nr:hypothetical protein [Burkholderiaceae bacterium]
MSDPLSFAKMVPGFDFLQGLVKNAGAALPGVGQWVAPTLDPQELDKRIQELRTVQFWLEQNAKLLGTTIQALEVQRMTLSTLKTMNVSLGDLTESLKIRVPEPAAPAPAPSPAAAPAPAPAPQPEASAGDGTAPPAAAQVPPGVIDPMQWWGALTQQFASIASQALNDGAGDTARSMVRQGLDAAGETLKKAAAMPAEMARTAAGMAQQAAAAQASGAAKGEARAAAKSRPRGAAGKTPAKTTKAAVKTAAKRPPR